MKHIIDLTTWERGSIFDFFKDFADSSISVTTELDCEEIFTYCKNHRQSFSLSCLYAISRAQNEVREMRYRIEEPSKAVVEYDEVNIITIVKVDDAGRYVEVVLEHHEDFPTFCKCANEVVHSIKADTPPFEYATEHPDDLGMMNVSITPDIYFTCVKTASRYSYGSEYPLCNIGKVVKHEGRYVMPIALTANHALIDGYGINRFFKIVEHTLRTLAGGE